MSSHARSVERKLVQPKAAARKRVQAKLQVGAVDDPMEAEADATANRVMAGLQAPSGGSTASREVDDELESKSVASGWQQSKKLQGKRVASRMGLEEEELMQGKRVASRMDEEEMLQGERSGNEEPKSIGAEGGNVDPKLEARLLAGSGQPMTDAVRSTMESQFGRDFSAVRVRENPAAAEIAALAYTVGHNIVFAPGQYQPESPAGAKLLAHELTHVVQQGAAGPLDPAKNDSNEPKSA